MKTILLIEDNVNILENLTEYLEMEGFKIIVANNGKRGLELANEFMPDLIVCDVRMPEMDGYEVFRLLKDMPDLSKIPFVFSTSMSEKVDRAASLKLGADDYIVKPFDPEMLVKMANKCMQTQCKRLMALNP